MFKRFEFEDKWWKVILVISAITVSEPSVLNEVINLSILMTEM